MEHQNEIELGALRRILQLSSRSFSLTLATCNSPRLRETLFARLRDEGFHFHVAALAPESDDPVTAVCHALPPDTSDAIFVTGLEELLAETTPGAETRLAILNRSRERWRTTFPDRALVFWLSEHTTVRVLVEAPDFRAWVSHELEFVEDIQLLDLASEQSETSRRYHWISNLDAAAKRSRLAELNQRLAAEPTDPALFQIWARAWDEKLILLRVLGELELAERHARELLARYPTNEKTALLFRAYTLGHLASILSHQGRFDEALHLLRDEQIPIVQHLGSVGELIKAQGKIADILADKGQLDEALHLLRDEQLPVLSRMGDVRSTAVTKAKVTDILIRLRRFDEALRLLRDDLLPALTQLGDVSLTAIIKAQVATILTARGQFDDALGIFRSELLPIFTRLGDTHNIAATLGGIANILALRGQFDESLAIRIDDVLPVYERLGDIRSVALSLANIALDFVRRGRDQDISKGILHLARAWLLAKTLQLPETAQFEQFAAQLGISREQLEQAAQSLGERSPAPASPA